MAHQKNPEIIRLRLCAGVGETQKTFGTKIARLRLIIKQISEDQQIEASPDPRRAGGGTRNRNFDFARLQIGLDRCPNPIIGRAPLFISFVDNLLGDDLAVLLERQREASGERLREMQKA